MAGLAHVILRRALRTAGEHGYLLLVMDTDDDRDAERRQLESLRDRQVDGILVVAPELMQYHPPEALVDQPAVLMNCLDPDHSVTSTAPDEVEAGRRAAEVLLSHQHQRIGLLVGNPETLQTRLRVAGVQQALRAGDGDVLQPVAAGRDVDTGFHAARRLLSATRRPTALICAHERLAVGAVLAAADLGLPVPTALSVISLEDGQQLAPNMVPPLTTVHRPDQAMTEHAVTLLTQQLVGDPPEQGEAPPLQLPTAVTVLRRCTFLGLVAKRTTLGWRKWLSRRDRRATQDAASSVHVVATRCHLSGSNELTRADLARHPHLESVQIHPVPRGCQWHHLLQ